MLLSQLIGTVHLLCVHARSGRVSEHVVFDQDIGYLVRNVPGLVQGIAFQLIEF